MVKVSVLVPVYNVKKYLRQCLDSLAAQTLDGIEFVCIDDGSTDGCSEILDAYAAQDVRFRVIHKENSGYGASMNVGLRTARGEYIGIVESDDFADAEMFERLYDVAEAQHAEVVKSNYDSFTDRDGNTFHEMLEGLPYRTICSAEKDYRLLQTDTFLWTSLYQKAFLLQNHIWFHETPGASYQDVSFSLKVALCCKRIYLVSEGYLHYRMDNPGASGHQVSKKYLCYHEEFAEYWRFLQTRSKEEQEIGTAASYNAWRIYQASCWPYVARRDRRRYLHRVIDEFQHLQQQSRLKENEWPQEAWGKLKHLLEEPAACEFDCIRTLQKERLLKEGFLQDLHQARKFYLYGAGKVAERLLQNLDRQGISVAGLLVQNLEGNPASVAGVPVEAWQEADADREHDLVVIAVTPRRPEVQQEIFFTLEQAGYQNVIVLTKELQEALA